jgi:POT family proton-dependent oligopeptide transporter
MTSSKLFLLLTLRLLSALPFAIYYSSFQLYLLQAGFAKAESTPIVGSMLALSFGLSLIGGSLAERLIDFRSFFVISIILQAIGCLAFITENHVYILIFTSLFLLGGMGLSVSLNMLVTTQFEAQDYGREKAFFWFYMSLNIGYFLGYSLVGTLSLKNSYHYIPDFIFLCVFICITVTLFNWKKLSHINVRCHFPRLMLIFILLIFIIYAALQYSDYTNIMIIVIWLSYAIFMFVKLFATSGACKNNIYLFYLLLFSSLLFWSIYFLAPIELIVFIQNKVDLTIYKMTVAPQWVQNTNTIVVIIGTILLGSLAKQKQKNSQFILKQFSFGIFSMCLGFMVLALGSYMNITTGNISLMWVIVSYVLQSIGELMIGPIGYALAGRLIPSKYQSIMMGVWVTTLGVAGALSSKLAQLAPMHSAKNNMLNYAHFFLYIGIGSFLLLTLILMWKKIIRVSPSSHATPEMQ